MTKISQLTALGSALAAGDQFFLRDISDASTPIKSVTADNIVELLLYGGDIGTAPNQIPLNQFLGSMAFEDNDAITVGKIAVDVNSAASPSIAISNDPDTGIYSPGDNQLAIATGGTERLRVTSTGQLRLAGAGITFNGDTAAANELDDYEEGTWTVELYDASSAGNISAKTATGYYTKIGRLVSIFFGISNIDTTGMTGANVLFHTLPFAAGSNASTAKGTAVLDTVTFPAGRTYPVAYINSSAARGFIAAQGTGVTSSSLTVSALTSGASDIEISLTYFT